MSYTDGFQQSVLKERAERIRNYLSENELKALVVMDPLNTIYASGLLVYGVAALRPMVTVIPLDQEPFMIQDSIYTNTVKYQLEHGRGWIRDIRPYLEHVKLTNRTYTQNQIDILLCETLREKGITKGRVGVDASMGTLAKWLGPHLPDLQCVDSSLLLREMRLVKCKEELDLIRKAGELSDKAMETYKNAVKVGKTLIELETETAYKISVNAAEKYPEYLIKITLGHLQGVGETGIIWNRSGYDGRKIKFGDQLIVYILVKFNAYSAENERMFFVGELTDKQKRIANIITEAHRKGIAACVAGNKVSDIDSACIRVIEEAGYGDYVPHRSGHGMGLGVHEYWLDMPFNHRIMKAGMVTSVEPSIGILGYNGFHHSDTVIIGDQEPEVVTKYSKNLEDLIVKA